MRTLDRIQSELDADLYDRLQSTDPDRNLRSTSFGPPYREYVEWEQQGDADGFIASYELDTEIAGRRGADQDTWYSDGPSSCKFLAALATKQAMQPILAGYGIAIRSIDHPQDDILLHAQTLTVQYPSPEKFVDNARRIEADPHKTFKPPVRFEVFRGDRYEAEQVMGKFATDRTVLLADDFGSHDILIHAASWLCLRTDTTLALQQVVRGAYDLSPPARGRRLKQLTSQLDTLINPLIISRTYGGQAFYGEELAALTGEDENNFQRKLAEHMYAPGTISLVSA